MVSGRGDLSWQGLWQGWGGRSLCQALLLPSLDRSETCHIKILVIKSNWDQKCWKNLSIFLPQPVLADWDRSWMSQFEWGSEKRPRLTCDGLYCASGECIPKVKNAFFYIRMYPQGGQSFVTHALYLYNCIPRVEIVKSVIVPGACLRL